MECREPIDSDFVFLDRRQAPIQQSKADPYKFDWDLSRKWISTTRSFMKTVRAYDPSLEDDLTPSINILGLNAIFSALKTPGKISDGISDFCHHFKMGDYGWAAISGVEVGTMIVDGIDSLVTVNSCLNGLDGRVPFSHEFSCVISSLVIHVTAITIFLKIAEIFQTKRFIEELKQKPDYVRDVTNDIRNSGRFKWGKKEIKASVKTSYMKKLERVTSSYFAAKSGKDRDSVLDFAQKKLTVAYVSLAANTTALCALKMLVNPLVPQVIPLAMLTGVSVTRIFTCLYEKHLGEAAGEVHFHSSNVKR